MKKLIIIAIVILAFGACIDHDDFDFVGKVVDYEPCQSAYEVGYAIELMSPDTVGGRYQTQQGVWYDHVVVVYGADRMLHPGDSVSGRIYLDPKFSKTQCMYHFEREAPEAVFTKLKKL